MLRTVLTAIAGAVIGTAIGFVVGIHVGFYTAVDDYLNNGAERIRHEAMETGIFDTDVETATKEAETTASAETTMETTNYHD